jgi:hypothetical protein
MTPPDNPAAAVAHEQRLDRAHRDLDAIAQLLDSPGWTYLARRLSEQREMLRENIADNDSLTDLETRAHRAGIRLYSEILNLPAQDRAVNLAFLARNRSKNEGPHLG